MGIVNFLLPHLKDLLTVSSFNDVYLTNLSVKLKRKLKVKEIHWNLVSGAFKVIKKTTDHNALVWKSTYDPLL